MYSGYFSRPFAAKVAKCVCLGLANEILAEVAGRASVNICESDRCVRLAPFPAPFPCLECGHDYLDMQQPSDHEN